ncbi:MAG TPA: hypothetical protein VFV67_24965 [Actinophytocola sp.]|uniref:hypothetical protein n=1 Tax=Actinophytocola sp. TaxID=1872138 RepID=UPI002DB6A921|nr:hypothetical protein [Actinophytocola sp.]HEU5473911.1 hypothetical protein [Actinophytocola sp.]
MLARVAAVLTVPPGILLAAAGQASADGLAAVPAAADGFNIAGPVGVAAVLMGIGGLVTGLLRRRRTVVSRSEAPTAVIEKIVEPVRGESVA